MNQYKFAVGQVVSVVPGARDLNVPPGKYKIQRLLPTDNKLIQYRVKHVVDGHERVLPENRLTIFASLG